MNREAGDNLPQTPPAPTLRFVDSVVEDEWKSGKLARFCRFVVTDGALFAWETFEWRWLLTDVYRTPERDAQLEGSGVHPAWRAVDVRIYDIDPKRVDRIVAYLNGKYVYDPKRPTMVVSYARPHGTGPHIHCQTHPRSTFRTTPRLA